MTCFILVTSEIHKEAKTHKRRTRCDRGRPCSECGKRNLTCDYPAANLKDIMF
ncbi:hypothetical protein PTTG_28387 [Puccinia triticina 1-1 BBBD Race 1]|uniref:Zn(2)-C6 fungal-type domain-containing protein n=1 Tax=Puccinia triticina (isolate 1-1 / race 1 (BBBD)) TaxID=630390 RepID=A0A180GC66_PUCT1|nr:hypothetical protein PTTG_28387 [Puccinia triticina 1-1 BBBD Race 1]